MLLVLAVTAGLVVTAAAQSMNCVWAKQIARTTNPDNELAIGFAMDGATNLFVTGWFDGTNDFGGVSLTNKTGGGQDIFVGKYNSAGTVQWARRAGGNTTEWDAGRGVGVDASGNVYVAGGFSGTADFGSFNVTAFQGQDFFLTKYNSAGTVQWVRQSGGGGGWAYGTGLAVDAAGNSYAVGYFDGSGIILGTTTLPNAGDYNVFLVKYDSAGGFQWAKALSSPGWSYSTAISLDTNNNVYIAGSFIPSLSVGTSNFVSAGAKDGFVAKFSSAGTFQWARQLGGPSDDAGLGSASVDASGNVYLVGGFGNTAGDTISFGAGITLTNLGGGLPGAGVGDAFLAKYNSSNGAAQWARRAGGTNMDAFTGIATDVSGNIYVGGGTGGVGMPDGFNVTLAKYDANGVVQWTQSSTGTNGALAWGGPLLDGGGNCYLAGWFHTSVGLGTNTLTGQGYWDFFLTKVAAPVAATAPGLGIGWSNGLPRLSITGVVGSRYAVDYVAALTVSNNWLSLATNTLSVNPLSFTDTNAIGNSRRFYRARLIP